MICNCIIMYTRTYVKIPTKQEEPIRTLGFTLRLPYNNYNDFKYFLLSHTGS